MMKWAIKVITFYQKEGQKLPTEKQRLQASLVSKNNKDSAEERTEMVLASLTQLSPLTLGMPVVAGIGQERS